MNLSSFLVILLFFIILILCFYSFQFINKRVDSVNEYCQVQVDTLHEYCQSLSRTDKQLLSMMKDMNETQITERNKIQEILKDSRYNNMPDKFSQQHADLIKEVERELRQKPVSRYKKVFRQHIYLIQSNDRYKIGITTNLKSRIAQLRTSSPYKLKLIHSFETDNASAEYELHKMFNEERVKGEWFELSDSDIKHICMIEKYQNGEFVYMP